MTTNKVNRKIYVGVHKTTKDTFDGYLGCGVYKTQTIGGNKTPFKNAVLKYGVDAFERVTIAEFEFAEQAYELEAKIVTKEFVDRKDTYNVALGGYAGVRYHKAIIQYTLDGKFLKVWDSITETSNYFNKRTHSALSKCLAGDVDTYLGFQWRYYTEDFPTIIAPLTKIYSINIHQYTISGIFVKTWRSAHEAAKELQGNPSAIKNSIRTSGVYLSSQWRIYNTDCVPEIIDEYIDPKLLLQLDESMNIVKEWASPVEAKKAGFNNISRGFNGKDKLVGGFKWCFKKDYKKLLQ